MVHSVVKPATRTRRVVLSRNFAYAAASVLIVVSIGDGSLLFAQAAESERSTVTHKHPQAISVSTHGLARYRPGRWGTLSVDAVNRESAATSIEMAAWIGGQENNQFGRSVWVPGEARRTTWAPIFIPPKNRSSTASMLYWMGVRKLGDAEVLSTAANRDRIESRQLIVPRGNVVFAVITSGEANHFVKSDLLKYVMSQLQSQTAVLWIEAGQLPVISEALNTTQVLVVIGDVLAQNSAATEAVQDWVRQGGTLWLMLDTMTAESAQVICSGEYLIQEVDRLSLTSYSLLTKSNAMQPAPDVVDLERPVQLVRVFSEPGNVVATADGWPAAVKSTFGQGRIIASMLSVDGFFVPRGKLQPEHAKGLDRQVWITTAGQNLVSELGRSETGVPLQATAMQEYVTSRIGLQLPGRSTGAAVLAVFCIGLMIVCVVVHRLQKPVLLLPGIGVLSALAIFSFLQIASSSRTSTDSTVTFQVVEASDTQDRLQVNGVTAFHSQGSRQPTIRSTAAGMLTLENPGSSGGPVRMLWSDQNSWQLQNAEFAAGVRLAEFRQTVAVQTPATATGTFDETGFRGRLTSDIAADWSDALVAGPSGFALPIFIESGGQFSNHNSPLPPGQHLDAAILDAEQSRRQLVYRSIFDVSKRSRVYPSRPTLLAWSAPLKLQTGLVDNDAPTGAMLATFPINIERPKSGSRVRIPSTFLPYRSVVNKRLKIGYAPTFNNSRRKWTTNTYSTTSTSLLRFEIPTELQPLVVDKATLTLNISAPLRDVAVLSGHPESLVEVWSTNSPVGEFDIPFPDEASRKTDDEGGFYVVLKVGAVQLDELDETEMGTQDRNWQVDWMQLEIQGLIQ
ncbi:MAG: hypothetical protein ACKVHE_06670 [Planctomycetales bacterium]|jgi:hypothetical protein